MNNKITLGISSCLIGENVRWNGDHKQDKYICEILGNYFNYIPICPEVEVGMGVPREAVALYGDLTKTKMKGQTSKTDWTEKMDLYINEKLEVLSDKNLCGYIFKSRSPSCGLENIPVHPEEGFQKASQGTGLFAKAFMKSYPLVPIEEEGRLNDDKIKENFIIKVFSFHRLKASLLKKGAGTGALVNFHTQNKFLILAHSRKHYETLGRIVANVNPHDWNTALISYIELFMESFTFKTTNKKNTDVLLHMLGFFKKILLKPDKKDLLDKIEDYRNGLIPLIVPITLIQHYVKKYKIKYLEDQIYLNPYPKELMLKNDL